MKFSSILFTCLFMSQTFAANRLVCHKSSGANQLPVDIEVRIDEKKIVMDDITRDEESYQTLNYEKENKGGKLVYKGKDNAYQLKFKIAVEKKMLKGKEGELDFTRERFDQSEKLKASYNCR